MNFLSTFEKIYNPKNNMLKIMSVSNAISFTLNNPEDVKAYLQPSNIPVRGFNNNNLYNIELESIVKIG